MTSSSFGMIKHIGPRTAPAAPAAAMPIASAAPAAPAARPLAGMTGEFLRMAGVAAASGVVFSFVAGLLVILIVNHGQVDPRPSQAAAPTADVARP